MDYSWLSIFALVFIPGLAIYLVIYLISKIINSSQLYAEFKQNLNELIMSILLFIIIVSVVSFGDDLAHYRLGVNSLINGSKIYVANETSNITSIIMSMDKFVKVASVQGSTSSYCTLGGAFGASLSGCGSYSVLTASLPNVLNALFITLAELKSLTVLLNFTNLYVITLLFPLGLFLRIFSFSRGAGGVILSIVITLYFVVPFTILIYSDLMQYVKGGFSLLQVPSVPSCDAANITIYNLIRVENVIPKIPEIVLQDMLFFVKTTLLVSLVLAVLVASPMALSRGMGVYVDFSSLQRLI